MFSVGPLELPCLSCTQNWGCLSVSISMGSSMNSNWLILEVQTPLTWDVTDAGKHLAEILGLSPRPGWNSDSAWWQTCSPFLIYSLHSLPGFPWDHSHFHWNLGSESASEITLQYASSWGSRCSSVHLSGVGKSSSMSWDTYSIVSTLHTLHKHSLPLDMSSWGVGRGWLQHALGQAQWDLRREAHFSNKTLNWGIGRSNMGQATGFSKACEGILQLFLFNISEAAVHCESWGFEVQNTLAPDDRKQWSWT